MSSSEIETSFLNTRELSRDDAYWRRLAMEDEPEHTSKRHSKQQQQHKAKRKQRTALDDFQQMVEESSASDSDASHDGHCGRSTESPVHDACLHYSPPSKSRAANDSDGFELPPPIDTSLPSSALRSAAVPPSRCSVSPPPQPVAGPSRHAHNDASSDSSDDLVILPASASKPKSPNPVQDQRRPPATSRRRMSKGNDDKRASLLALGRNVNSHQRQGSSISPHRRKSQHQRLLEELNFSDPEEPQPHEHDVLQQLQRQQPVYVGSDQEHVEGQEEEEEEDVPLRLLAGKPKRTGAGWFLAPAASKGASRQQTTKSRQSGGSTSIGKSHPKGSQDLNQPKIDFLSQSKPKEVDLKGKKRARPEPLFIDDDDEEADRGEEEDDLVEDEDGEEQEDDESTDILQGPGMLAGLSEDKRAMSSFPASH